TTMLAVLALDSRRAKPAAPDSLAAGRARAAKWLAKAKGSDNHQELALRIVLKTSSGAPAAEYNPLVEKLVNSQRADGGWAQTKDMPSDAFATGQSLYALTLTGKKAEAPVVQKARMFLVRSQHPDGSWPMISRPVQTGGKGANNLEPITYAGAAWAILGLARSSEQV